jgi:hypothetical protein
MTSNNQPIACTLGTDQLRARRAWIADLTREALLDHKRNGLVLHLRYKPQAVDRVREMVCLEGVCCAFLKFEIRELPDEVSLTITTSEAAHEAAGALFDQLVATARP